MPLISTFGTAQRFAYSALKRPQAAFRVGVTTTPPSTLHGGQTVNIGPLTVSGGSGTGAVTGPTATLTTTTGSTLVGTVYTAGSSGAGTDTITVTATKAGDIDYEAAVSTLNINVAVDNSIIINWYPGFGPTQTVSLGSSGSVLFGVSSVSGTVTIDWNPIDKPNWNAVTGTIGSGASQQWYMTVTPNAPTTFGDTFSTILTVSTTTQTPVQQTVVFTVV